MTDHRTAQGALNLLGRLLVLASPEQRADFLTLFQTIEELRDKAVSLQTTLDKTAKAMGHVEGRGISYWETAERLKSAAGWPCGWP